GRGGHPQAPAGPGSSRCPPPPVGRRVGRALIDIVPPGDRVRASLARRSRRSWVGKGVPGAPFHAQEGRVASSGPDCHRFGVLRCVGRARRGESSFAVGNVAAYANTAGERSASGPEGPLTATAVERWEPPLPKARGPITDGLLAALVGSPVDLPTLAVADVDPLADGDLHLALYVC